MTIDAIVWDYDGTLVNSAAKNISITKDILGEVAPGLSGSGLPGYLKKRIVLPPGPANHGFITPKQTRH